MTAFKGIVQSEGAPKGRGPQRRRLSAGRFVRVCREIL